MRGKGNQIRSTIRPGGLEDGGTNGTACRDKIFGLKNMAEGSSAETKSVGAGTALSSASGACFPLQHFCPELEESGVDGAESWQPK
jgi:hypothetical protein